MLLYCLLTLHLFALPKENCLCKKNERIVFSFLTTKKKMVSVCTEKGDQYLVYRYGTPGRIELQFPEVLDETSWQKFELYSYFRGGGIENAGVDEKHLSFTTEGVSYELYENYQAIGNKVEIGVLVTTLQRSHTIIGVVRTKKGEMSSLEGKVTKADF
jgi:hypothetical protein